VKDSITIEQGSGGSAMMALVSEFVLKNIKRQGGEGVTLGDLDDSGSIVAGETEIVLTTDAHTVKPLFFPGGDIGALAAAGTLNDISVMGVKPLALSSSLVIEEGFPSSDLSRILKSMNGVLEEVGADLITGDTKVLEKGDVDGLIITTAGVGIGRRGEIIRDSGMKPGDAIILSGSVGDHGISILSVREGFDFELQTGSDVGPVWGIVSSALEVGGINAMKDPTRGGLANSLNEMAEKSNLGIEVEEEAIPVKEDIRSAAEMLGVDPYSITNEGKVVIAVDAALAGKVLEAIRKAPRGRDASIIGKVIEDHPGDVVMETVVGGRRLMETPVGDPAPRIC
jgi:hydrogenase expression/formation protein HypE